MLGADLERLRSLTGIKWSRDGGDTIAAWVADMDFETAPVVKAAMQEVIDRGDFGYNFTARDQLVDAWSDWQHDSFGWRPPHDECRVVTSTLAALSLVLELHTEPGDGVVLFTPIYHPFRNVTVESGRRVVEVPLADPDFGLDAERFAAAIDERTRLVLFCNPHNPLGRMFGHEELAAFSQVCIENDLLVVSDEIWCDLTHQPGHLPMWDRFPDMRERTITLGSASKSFNLAGLRCAVVHIGAPHVRAQIDALPPHFVPFPASLGSEASLAAWRHGRPWLEQVSAQLTANRDHLASRVAADLPGVSMHLPEATYLAWLDFGDTPIAADPAGVLRKHGGVALHAGATFDETWASHVRLNFATSPAILDLMIDRIAHTLESA